MEIVCKCPRCGKEFMTDVEPPEREEDDPVI